LLTLRQQSQPFYFISGNENSPLIAIVGTSGVGKTSLARALAGATAKIAKFFNFSLRTLRLVCP
jgi:ATP-dependent Lon protease